MKADAYDLSKVFGYDRQLFAPLFQRPYVWEKEKQWKPLWEDIKTISEKILEDEKKLKPHFLGAVVLEQFRVPVDKPDARSVIDGQQRLTTLQILLAAVRDVCIGKEDLDKIGKSAERLIFNDNSVVTEEVDRYKVWPTNIDQLAYKIIMTTHPSDEANLELARLDEKGRSNMIDAYFFFVETIREWASEDGELSKDRLQALVNTIRKGLRLVVVDMEEEDNAQLIFETLNARGTPLLPSDLVKNFLFHRAREDNLNVEALYESFWHPFDSEHRFWREEITQGRLKRPRIDLLLQHHLTLHKKDDVSARSLFQEFQLHTENNADKGPKVFLKSLKKHGAYFKHFLTILKDTREGTFFHRLKIMDTTTVFPFLLGLYEDFDDHSGDTEEKVKVLVALESYLIRRMVCRLTTKNYNRFFLELLTRMDANGHFSYEAVQRFLLRQTSDTSRWPSDKEFAEAWFNVPIYHAITRPRLRMILIALDEGLQSPKSEPYTLKDHLTVEHLMPQLWKDHWPFPEIAGESYDEKNYRIEKRNQLIQTIGNLFYLTKSLNPYVSNGPFEAKKEAILEHSAIKINRKFLVNAPSWDEDTIMERSKQLFNVALGIWSYPADVVPEVLAEPDLEQGPREEPDEYVTQQKREDLSMENRFFDEASEELGGDDGNVLRSFFDMIQSGPFNIRWKGAETLASFDIVFSDLSAKPIISVLSNGKMEIGFRNLRGTEDAEVFKEVLKEEIEDKLSLEFPVSWHDEYVKFLPDKWLSRSDILADILHDLLGQMFETEQ